MTLSDEIKKVMDDMTDDGTLEKIVRDTMAEKIKDIIKDTFSYGSDAAKALRDRISATLVPYIKDMNMDKYLASFDTMLTDIIKETQVTEQKEILDNFKNLMSPDIHNIKMSQIYDAYAKYVAADCDTSELEAHNDGDGPCYDSIAINAEIDFEEEKPWSHKSRATINLTAEGQDKLCKTIHISKWNEHDAGDKWRIDDYDFDGNVSIRSLRYMSEFDCLISKLMRSYADIELDEDDFEDSVTPDETPEYTLI